MLQDKLFRRKRSGSLVPDHKLLLIKPLQVNVVNWNRIKSSQVQWSLRKLQFLNKSLAIQTRIRILNLILIQTYWTVISVGVTARSSVFATHYRLKKSHFRARIKWTIASASGQTSSYTHYHTKCACNLLPSRKILKRTSFPLSLLNPWG